MEPWCVAILLDPETGIKTRTRNAANILVFFGNCLWWQVAASDGCQSFFKYYSNWWERASSPSHENVAAYVLPTPTLYTDKTFLTFLRGFESVQSKQLILELAKQNIEVLNTKSFVFEVTHYVCIYLNTNVINKFCCFLFFPTLYFLKLYHFPAVRDISV